jgi:hypothetical protein
MRATEAAARTADARGLRLLGHSDLGGYGDGMQVLRDGDALYVGHVGASGMGTSILEVSDPARPKLVRQLPAPPGTHSHKVQVAGGLLLVNHERFRGSDAWSAGMAVYRLGDPFTPRQIGWFDAGGQGVHRIVWDGGRYAYLSATPDGAARQGRVWLIVDLADPEHPVEAGRWSWPGPVPAGKRYAAHHALVQGERAYLGYGDAGMVILDIADVTRPRLVAQLNWAPGGDTHTCMPLPGRGLVVVTDEATADRCQEDPKLVRVVDVHDETHPAVIGLCPPPEGDFCQRGLRFGPHNLHEHRTAQPAYRSETLIFVTYFNAGLRVYDLTDPTAPAEVAHFIPTPAEGQEAPQSNDVFVDASGLVYLTDRVGGGLDILQPDATLAARMRRAAQRASSRLRPNAGIRSAFVPRVSF